MLLRKSLAMLVFIAFAILPPLCPMASTITVDDDGPADYASIEEAVNAVGDGDTVFVKAGTYYECGIVLTQGALLKGEGPDVTKIVGRMDEFFSKNWSRYQKTFEEVGSFPPKDRSAPRWKTGTFILWEISWVGVPIEGLTLSWEGEERGGGILVSSGFVTISRCKLTENFVGILLGTDLNWPHYQVIEANTITGNDYGVVWSRGYSDYGGPSPGNADHNWWGTVVESEIKAGFLDTSIQYYPEAESWLHNEEAFREVCYPWLQGPVDIENFVERGEAGVHYNNIYGNEINFATPLPLKQTAVRPASWGQIKNKMR
ncbi:MAG: hypothetical protein J7J76_04020 [Candidatus Latescibacteria bacterium]|nr:hypothetical protein [Candidatus Latescibacterota bacterium]